LFDSIIAGYASRLARSESLDSAASRVTADEGTLRFVSELRAKETRTREEQAFLDYFGLLDEVRLAIVAAANKRE